MSWRRDRLSDPHGNTELSFPSAVGLLVDEGFFFVVLFDVKVVVDSLTSARVLLPRLEHVLFVILVYIQCGLTQLP